MKCIFAWQCMKCKFALQCMKCTLSSVYEMKVSFFNVWNVPLLYNVWNVLCLRTVWNVRPGGLQHPTCTLIDGDCRGLLVKYVSVVMRILKSFFNDHYKVIVFVSAFAPSWDLPVKYIQMVMRIFQWSFQSHCICILYNSMLMSVWDALVGVPAWLESGLGNLSKMHLLGLLRVQCTPKSILSDKDIGVHFQVKFWPQ